MVPYPSAMANGIQRQSRVAPPLLWLVACLLVGCARLTVSVPTDQPPTNPTTDQAPPSASTPFHSAAGRFSVEAPGTFEETVRTTNNPNLGPIEVHYFLATLDGGPRYAVVYGDYPSAFVESTPLEVIYQESRDADVAAADGRLVEAGSLTVAGHPADQHIVDGKTGFQRFVTVLVGNRGYSIAVRGTEAQVRSAEATRFIASFALDAE
jgi:hypothetical protein